MDFSPFRGKKTPLNRNLVWISHHSEEKITPLNRNLVWISRHSKGKNTPKQEFSVDFSPFWGIKTLPNFNLKGFYPNEKSENGPFSWNRYSLTSCWDSRSFSKYNLKKMSHVWISNTMGFLHPWFQAVAGSSLMIPWTLQIIAEMVKPCILKKWNVVEYLPFIAVNTRLHVM